MFESFMRPATLVSRPGTPNESRREISCVVQAKEGLCHPNEKIFEGDVIELPDPRGGLRQLSVATVEINEDPHGGLSHLKLMWGPPPTPPRTAEIRRLGLEGLHPEILRVSSALYTDRHYASAVSEAFKAIEIRVRQISGLDVSGRDLMARAFAEGGPIKLSTLHGRSGQDEQEGFRFLFMGAIAGIRNPKAHEHIQQTDPQRTLEYLAFASMLMRRLNDSVASSGAQP